MYFSALEEIACTNRASALCTVFHLGIAINNVLCNKHSRLLLPGQLHSSYGKNTFVLQRNVYTRRDLRVFASEI